MHPFSIQIRPIRRGTLWLALRCFVLALLIASAHAWADEDEAAQLESLPMQMRDFRMTDTQGNAHRLSDYQDAPAIVLFNQMNGCPIVRQSYPYLREIREQYAPKGVVFLYISSNQWDTDEAIDEECAEYGVSVPVLRDQHRAFAHALGVERSAEVFVVDPKSLAIVYRGMADDRFDYGLQRMSPKKFWLREALDAHLGGEAPATRKTAAKGCLMDLAFYDDVTYTGDIVPLIEGKLAPLFETVPKDEAEAKTHSDVIVDTLLTGRIARGGEVKEVSFTEEEGQILLAWMYGAANH